MALWKASGGKFKLDFRPWHGGRQGRNLNKELEFRSGIVEGKRGTEEFDFRSCQEGKSGTINKGLDFKIRHCGRQGRGKFIKSQILDSSFKNKSWILDHGIVEGKRREV